MNARVRAVAEAIQSQLEPHPGLAHRNAHAHIWLGINTIFGEDWRDRAQFSCVMQCVEWIHTHPNDDYENFPGPIEFRTVVERGLLFETESD